MLTKDRGFLDNARYSRLGNQGLAGQAGFAKANISVTRVVKAESTSFLALLLRLLIQRVVRSSSTIL
jgi:hypothetical protein